LRGKQYLPQYLPGKALPVSQKLLAIRETAGRTATKTVAANQKAIDALPLNSGNWRIAGVPGLYVRCRAQSKSYWLQRRVRGRLAKLILGEMSLKEARAQAIKEWSRLRPAPPDGRKTLARAFEEYVSQKALSAKSLSLYRYNWQRYLGDWQARPLAQVGEDRSGVRALYHDLAKRYGAATASQVIRMLRAVYNYARKVDPDLQESPTIAVALPALKSRDWALSREELKVWWLRVRTLGPIKRMWWLTALFTGARRGSVEALEWSDIDLEKKTIRFRVTKGDRPYTVPAADKLVELLKAYRESGEVPPSRWVFPSRLKADAHLVNARDDKKGIPGSHHLRHTYRTVLAELGAAPDQARLLMGHSMGGDVSRGYITAPLLVESLRPITNAVAAHYLKILGGIE
jgi:integrase